MNYKTYMTSQFKKDLKLAKKPGYSIEHIQSIISLLANGEKLPAKYKDHALTGKYSGYRECHIEPDWLLVYEIHEEKLILIITRTGTHADIFFLIF